MQKDQETLEKDLRSLLEEARVVIPGVQTLLGFQLTAVFNQLFPKTMTETMQYWHLASIALTALAMILIMSPASYHRMACLRVSEKLVRYSSMFLISGMFALAAGISIDIELVASIILSQQRTAAVIAGIIFALFICQWFIFPSLGKRALQ